MLLSRFRFVKLVVILALVCSLFPGMTTGNATPADPSVYFVDGYYDEAREGYVVKWRFKPTIQQTRGILYLSAGEPEWLTQHPSIFLGLEQEYFVYAPRPTQDFYFKVEGLSRPQGNYPSYYVGWTNVGSTEVIKISSNNTKNGTHHFYTSFESGEIQPTWNDSVISNYNVGGYYSHISPEASVRANELSYGPGNRALMFSGTDKGGNPPYTSFVYFRTIDVNILVRRGTTLSYDFLPQNEHARQVSVLLETTDGIRSDAAGATTLSGVSMSPLVPKGSVGQWTSITSRVGDVLEGKTIDRIIIAYRVNVPKSPLFRNKSVTPAQFRGYIDNITIAGFEHP